jgi:hypothetical protein
MSLAGYTLLRVEVLSEDGTLRVDTIPNWPTIGETRAQVTLDVSALPEKIRNKLAVLMMRSYDPPTEDIQGIGRRIDKYTFWVYVGDEEWQ